MGEGLLYDTGVPGENHWNPYIEEEQTTQWSKETNIQTKLAFRNVR
jgi:hypothetical protein